MGEMGDSLKMADIMRKALGQADMLVNQFSDRSCQSRDMPQNVLKFVLSRNYENSAHFGAYLVTDKVSSKNSSTTVSA